MKPGQVVPTGFFFAETASLFRLRLDHAFLKSHIGKVLGHRA